MARYQAVRGTFDVLPGQVPRWQQLETTARKLAHRFGFREMRTPLFEQAELYTKGMGVMSGLIENELWTFKDKYGQKLALRADLTSGVVRAYQQNKLYESKQPQKLFYLGTVFLLGKEGKERSRQSHQFGFEALGSDSAAMDAEVIALASCFCESIGLEGHSIRLNSLGGSECRPLYLQKLKDYFSSNNEALCGTCKRKYKAHPDWVLSCEEPGCKRLSQVAPTIYGMLSNGEKTHFAQLREYLEAMELPVELDPRVVRDSEYYNRTVFEIQCGGKSVGFGGRYDTLVEKLGGKSTPAVGFALSMEAVLELLGEEEESDDSAAPFVYFQPEGPESSKLLVPLMNTLRQKGVSAELDYRSGNRRPQAAPEGCSYCVVLDESNAFRGHAILKDLDKGKDEKVPVSRLSSRVAHLVGLSQESDKDSSSSSSGSGRKRLRRGRRRNEEEKQENKSSRDNEEKSDSSKRRRGRRTKDSDDNNKDSDNKRRDKESSREKKTRSRSDKGRKEKPRRERTETEDDGGKAIVPAFNLGSAPSPAAKEPAKTKSKSKSKSKSSSKSGSKPKASAAAASLAGGLNWSILPGKEGGKSNGKSDSPGEAGEG